jgi:hypothetical protein
MKLNKSIFLLLVGVFCLTISVSAQKTWEKPLEKWSKSDALKIVSDSPWAQTYQSTATGASQQQLGREVRDTANNGGGGRNAGGFNRTLGNPPIVIRLHSALPVRQAIVRGRQIVAKYDKMKEDEKAKFDESLKGYLACAICQDYYVVSFTQFPDTTGQTVQDAIFQQTTMEDLKDNVWLINDKGERRELVQFTPPKGQGDSAYFFFARKDDKGNLLLTPDNKDFKFVFSNNFFTTSNRYAPLIPQNFEFKVSKLMIGDKIEF